MIQIKSLLVILGFTLISATASAQDWVVSKVIDSVTVKMPGTPTQTDKGGQVGHELILNDSTKYSYLTINFEDFGLDANALAQMLDTDEFAEQYKSGIAAQGEIMSEKKGTVDNKYPYFEYELKVEDKGKPVTAFIRTTFYKAIGIAQVYTPGLKGTDAALKTKYFDSLSIGK